MAFKAVGENSLRKERRIYANDQEWLEIQNAAGIRHMTVSNYVVTVALGRKTDVTFDANITVQISRLVAAIRDFAKQCHEQNIVMPKKVEEGMLEVIAKAKEYLCRELPVF